MNSEINKQMIIDLISKPDFMSRLVEQEDIQSVKDLFKSEANIELSEQDVVTLGNTIDKCYKQIKSLSDDEMEKTVGAGLSPRALGGAVGALVGLSASIAEEWYVAIGSNMGAESGTKKYKADLLNREEETPFVEANIKCRFRGSGKALGKGSAIVLGTAGGAIVGAGVAEGICRFTNRNK